jgi:hypothetical protein
MAMGFPVVGGFNIEESYCFVLFCVLIEAGEFRGESGGDLRE